MKLWIKIVIIEVLALSVIGVYFLKTFHIKQDTTIGNVTQKNIPTLVDLGSDICNTCKQMIPVLEEVDSMYSGKVLVKTINVNKNPKEANSYKIRVIPTQIFLDKDGMEVYRHEGYLAKEDIIKVFEKMGVKKVE